MAKGHMYLVAVMDWYSRKVLSWRISNTMEEAFCIDALREAIAKYGKPLIFNTDQGSQFTGEKILFKKVCKAQKFTIFELTNFKSIYHELYTTASKRNFRSDSLRPEWLSTNSQVFSRSYYAC
jgi:hypothetical protein